MNEEQNRFNLPPTDTGFIWALIAFGILGSGLGGGLLTADSQGTVVFGAIVLGVCGVGLSIGTIAAGVAVGLGVMPGKTSSSAELSSARAPKITEPQAKPKPKPSARAPKITEQP